MPTSAAVPARKRTDVRWQFLDPSSGDVLKTGNDLYAGGIGKRAVVVTDLALDSPAGDGTESLIATSLIANRTR